MTLYRKYQKTLRGGNFLGRVRYSCLRVRTGCPSETKEKKSRCCLEYPFHGASGTQDLAVILRPLDVDFPLIVYSHCMMPRTSNQGRLGVAEGAAHEAEDQLARHVLRMHDA